MAGNNNPGNGYSSGLLCGVCRWATTDACYTSGPQEYWKNFEPRPETLENPPDFPNIKKWHRMGYGEKLNVLGFYMRALLENGKGRGK